jgi:predicted CopG family antitoxin
MPYKTLTISEEAYNSLVALKKVGKALAMLYHHLYKKNKNDKLKHLCN